MPGLKVNTLYDANGYLNGKPLFGQAEEFTIPGIKPKNNDHKALGLAGTIDIPSGFEKMEFKMKNNSLYPDTLKEFADIYKEHTITVFGNLQNWDGNNLSSEVMAKCTIIGKSKGTPDIGIKHQDNPELENLMTVTSVKLEVDGTVIYHLDIMSNIYIVNGEDKWAKRRQNLGLA